MDHKYLLEHKSTRRLTFNDIVNNKGFCVLYILCYSISEQCKYPFLQFMMEKIPYCNNVAKEQITLPYLFLRDSATELEDIVLQRVMSGLDLLGCDYKKVSEDMYKGIIFSHSDSTPYALVNITGIDINGLNFMRQSTCWFVLPSEIINSKLVCNIDVDAEITKLFTNNPQMGCLMNSKTNEYYMLPDAVYTGSELKKSEFQVAVGNTKQKIYPNCGKYYFYYRTFWDAVKDGGWLHEGEPDKIGDRLLTCPEDNTNVYVSGCINRYALFVEGKIYFESASEFTLTDKIIDSEYPEPCIIISYRGEHCIKPDMLVKNSESFHCLSYHKLNKHLLDAHFIDANKKQYMIS